VQVQFRTNKLRKQYEDVREAEKAHGRQVARRYVERINILKHARDIEEVKQLPGLDCHELKGRRQGQWAVKLTGFYRLIFTLQGEQLQIARVEEVSKHYDD
jgi:proteic killer suppression protein